MSPTTGSPMSAFAVYKQKSCNKKHDTTIALKKRKENSSDTSQPKKKAVPSTSKISKGLPKRNERNSKQKRSKISTGKPQKNNSTKKQNSKMNGNKKIKKIKLKSNNEPPLLVPIQFSNVNKNEPLDTDFTSRKIMDASLSEILTTIHKTDPSPEGLKLFKWLIASVNPQDFFEKYWEKEILFIERSSQNYYKNLLSTQRLDDIFREFPLYYTRNVDVVSYENGVKEVHNEEGRVVASALYDYYSNGCSIRVLNPQTYDQKVHLLIATLQEYFGTMVGTNVYLTPPNSQGFAPHFDDIEAFIVQLEGRKHWKLYKPK